MPSSMRDYYQQNPLMVSSPFGGVQGVNRALVDSVFHQLDLNIKGASVLDVGCGRGFMREVVLDQQGRYCGVDIVAHAERLPITLADAQQLPFRDGQFDVVMCVDAFEHIPDMARAATEFHRVLRSGGQLFLSVPNYANVAGLVKWVSESLGWYEPDTWAPFRQWQPQELEQFTTTRRIRRTFQAAGFKRLRRIPHPGEVGLGVCPWMDHKQMPEAVKFRLQRFFGWLGPTLADIWPDASLHGFWKMEKE